LPVPPPKTPRPPTPTTDGLRPTLFRAGRTPRGQPSPQPPGFPPGFPRTPFRPPPDPALHRFCRIRARENDARTGPQPQTGLHPTPMEQPTARACSARPARNDHCHRPGQLQANTMKAPHPADKKQPCVYKCRNLPEGVNLFIKADTPTAGPSAHSGTGRGAAVPTGQQQSAMSRRNRSPVTSAGAFPGEY
jgi:hypothetical protein